MFVTKKKYQELEKNYAQVKAMLEYVSGLNDDNVHELINVAAEKNTLQDRLDEVGDVKESILKAAEQLGPTISKQELKQLINNL